MRGARTFAGLEEDSMQKADAYGRNDERDEIPSEEGAAQQLEQILASGLLPLYRRAYLILGNASDAQAAVQDALLAAIRTSAKMDTGWRQYDVKSERRQQRLKGIQGYEWVLILSWLCALVLWGFTWWAAFRLLCSMVQFVQYVPRLLP
jgi:hypothetical protein